MEVRATAKHIALEAWVTLRRGAAQALRRADGGGQPRCTPELDERHLASAAGWIARAQDATPDGGVAAMYSLIQGWVGSYAETTGYIIPTMFDAALRLGRSELCDRAVRMAEWLLSQQFACGAFPGLFVGRSGPPRVFNTAQVLFGLVRAADETGRGRYLDAAVRAGDWLVAVQDHDGAWRRHTLNGIVHAYNARSAWALIHLHQATGERRFRDAGAAGADWAAGQQLHSGWFAHNTFCRGQAQSTLHTFVYAVRGLLECAVATGTWGHLESARRGADALLACWRRHRRIPGSFAQDFSPQVRWRCLPGEAQLAVAWLRLAAITGARSYRNAAVELLDDLKPLHFLDAADPNLRGGLSGSFPINGGYERYCLVNWGPKFLIDALILKGRDS